MSDEQAAIPQGMRPGRRELNECSLLVSMSAAVPAHMRERVRELSLIYTPIAARNRKLATMLLNLVCQEADANELILLLTSGSYEQGDEAQQGLDDDQLIAWYKRFGFVALPKPHESAPTLMARNFKSRVPSPIRRAVKLALVH